MSSGRQKATGINVVAVAIFVSSRLYSRRDQTLHLSGRPPIDMRPATQRDGASPVPKVAFNMSELFRESKVSWVFCAKNLSAFGIYDGRSNFRGMSVSAPGIKSNLEQQMSKRRGFVPHQPVAKSSQITAQGPQDLKPMSVEQFTAAMAKVARAFLSAVILPAQFFEGIPLTGVLSGDSGQRILLTAFAHFNKNTNLALNFFCRYKALMAIRELPELAEWVVTEGQTSDFAVFMLPLLSASATHPLQPNGSFEPHAFVQCVRSVAKSMSPETSDEDAESPVPVAAPRNVLAPNDERIAA